MGEFHIFISDKVSYLNYTHTHYSKKSTLSVYLVLYGLDSIFKYSYLRPSRTI